MTTKKTTPKTKGKVTTATLSDASAYVWSAAFLSDFKKMLALLPTGSPLRQRLSIAEELFGQLYYARYRASGRAVKTKDFSSIKVVIKKGKKS